MQESRLLNLNYGTGHSLGLFQQQWDMGWGTPQQIMNPAYASGKFLEALRSYQATDPAWASQPLYQAAQGVQRSGFPFGLRAVGTSGGAADLVGPARQVKLPASGLLPPGPDRNRQAAGLPRSGRPGTSVPRPPRGGGAHSYDQRSDRE